MSANEEQSWIAAARRGDRSAFSKLVQAYQVPVYNLAYRMLGDRHEAEEAAQETFLRAYTRLSTYNPQHKFSTWILSIASHYCIDQLRRRRFTWLSLDGDKPLDWLGSDSEGPDEAVLRSERAAMVRALLLNLAPGYRAPLILRYWYDLSYQEIAQVLDLSEPAVKSRLHRARQQLADLITRQQAPTAASAHAGSDHLAYQNGASRRGATWQDNQP